ncbi:putative kinesin [Patellaria atrata CBS 101060]|uniref:Kinesin n=1 Tax=Patellaria atrata CBS 101060 TaxID=1346257 RepID=A0A9P4VMC5_9PEZI|nr:putative kinesin [Patellaria atrata CBS 101060]
MACNVTATPTGTKFGPISSNSGVIADHLSGNIIERPETPPSPSCNIPFCRDPDFVDRGTLLDQIHEKCSTPASRIALVGFGGVGKSQLAIEHCYRTADRSPETWVFWVHASNAARVEQGYRAIADQVKLAGRKDPRADIFELVYNWLRSEKNGKWLLVLDNVDDAVFLSLQANNGHKTQTGGGDRARQRHLLSYLPQSKNGAVLVTSWTRKAARELVEETDIITIEPMNGIGAQALLRKKLGEGIDNDGIAELATALEFIPLALVQAAAYIRQRAPRCSIRQYLDQFHKNDRKKTSLLDYEGGHLRRDHEAKNSILLTWQISFDFILYTRRSAANLLSLMSFFDRQGIPEALIRTQSGMGNRQEDVGTINLDGENSNSDDSKSEASIDDGFEEDILTLRNYSFIALTTDAITFDMHRLVQLATRKWLEGQGQLETWKQQYINNLCIEFPTGEHKNWVKCQALFPHVKSALSQPPKSEECLRQWALLLYRAAWYAWQKGSLSDAEKLSMRSMKVRTKLLGREHEDTLSSMGMVGLATSLAGRVLGEEHPDTLTSMANLAFTFKVQGRKVDAILLMRQCSQLQKQILGPQHPYVISSVASLNKWQLENVDIAV